MKKEKDVINILSKAYTYAMLRSLEEGPRRFKDLADACQNEKMRTQRLREFEKFGLLKATARRVSGRAVTIYELSDTGKSTLKLAEDIKKLQRTK